MKILNGMTGASLLTLIFLALFVPSAYREVKIILLLLALIGITILAFQSKLFWSSETLLACLVLATFGLINSIHGEMNAAPGAIHTLSVMAVWPILFMILSAMLNRPHAIRLLVLTLEISLIAILIYSFLFLGKMAEIVPDSLYFELDQGQAIGFYSGRIRFALYSLPSLLFLLPFWAHYLLILNSEKRATAFHWGVLFIGLVLCFLSGRNGLVLVILILPLTIVATELIAGVRGRLFRGLLNWHSVVILIIGLFMILTVFLSMNIEFDALVDRFMSGFDFHDVSNPDASERGNQYISLMQAWQDGNYLFGAGNGSNTEYLRSHDMPWAYELTYVYLLFSTGIVGVLFYFGWFGWGLVRIRDALMLHPNMAPYVLPIITGVISLAIGAASNPYFGKFDYLWIILLPHLLAGAIGNQDGKKIV